MEKTYYYYKKQDSLLIINKKPFVNTLLIENQIYPVLTQSLKHETKKSYYLMYPMEALVSGLLLCSENKKLAQELVGNSKDYFIYDVVVCGKPLFQEPYLSKSLTFQDKKIEFDEKGTEIELYITIIQKYRDYTHLQVKINKPVGRAVLFLLSFLGNPVLGDKLYGLKEDLYLSSLKKRKFKFPKEEDEKPLVKRPCLHLSSFYSGNKNNSFEVSLAKDFQAVINQLNKYNRFIEEKIFLENILKKIQSS